MLVSGATGPEPKRRCTVTFSGTEPGLKTSISDMPPVASSAWGIAQWVSGRASPGTTESPLLAPT